MKQPDCSTCDDAHWVGGHSPSPCYACRPLDSAAGRAVAEQIAAWLDTQARRHFDEGRGMYTRAGHEAQLRGSTITDMADAIRRGAWKAGGK